MPVVVVTVFLAAASLIAGQPGLSPLGQAKSTDLDAFMERVLARREEGWRKLHDYILSERERFDLTGPGGARLDGSRREFSWYVRDGYLIRSPVRYDGVTIGEAERRQYEDRWMAEEKAREERRAKRKADDARGSETPPAAAKTTTNGPALDGVIDERGEPRFISEAFFLKFKFEPGNYYLVGREQVEGREVVRIEYYPTRLFQDHDDQSRKSEAGNRRDKDGRKEAATERDIERGLNKVALITLWIDPAEYQIVRYEFDNVDFGFLPARWLFRLDNVQASMTMGRMLDGLWLPRAIDVRAGLTVAPGGYQFRYGREFYDYRKAETAARVRSYGTSER